MKKTLFFLLLINIAACNTLGGKRGISDTMEDSKKIGTYLKEYEIVSGNSEQLRGVKNIWAEYAWNHPYTFKERKIRKERQTLLLDYYFFQSQRGYDTTWALEDISGKEIHYFNSNEYYHQIFCETGNYTKDTVRLNLVRGDLQNNKITEKKEIILVARKEVK